MNYIELLAPAKNIECGMAAIDHGADAVYIGAQQFGARQAAGNSIDDIRQLCAYAHKFMAKVYVTVNTILFDNETEPARQLIEQLCEAGADAILVQDMSLLKMPLPAGVEMHASTQTDNRTAAKVKWLRNLGFRRVVLARELSAKEIGEIHHEVPDVELEVFVHGALCVSYSGMCYASQHCFGRSANRGECAQFCRLKFDLTDATGRPLMQGRHLLSLKDMCQIDRLDTLMQAGATSFKIEGRLKDIAYVKNVVAAYSQRLNEIIARQPDKYCRASLGRCTYDFTPNLKKTFNRGFTHYFLDGRQMDIASFDTPKAMGEYVGKVKEIRHGSFNVAGTASFANGDGLCFINGDRELEGFRVNRAEGGRLFPYKMPRGLKPGDGLYRNNDQEFERIMARPTSTRKIGICMTLSETEGGISLSLTTGNGIMATCHLPIAGKQVAEKPQAANIERQLTKLGNTPFVCRELTISPDGFNLFIPSAQLTQLRREATLQLEEAIAGTLAQRKTALSSAACGSSEQDKATRHKSDNDAMRPNWYDGKPQYLYNISNKLAGDFYKEHGMTSVQPAFEKARQEQGLIMQCRHCLRYSLGHCVKRGGTPPSWKEPLYLQLPDGQKFRLEFCCKECQMNVYSVL